ncbi:regulatory protein, TetR [Phenylobacterium zucineum HLK1]|uniref:Regulatory protein, TetR n=1 Tax=Phenylobacterium zucineum (strain HLK1) TaxID=450851 RepID=B4RA78_PHEZH|nr:regulatory protein, TetR [Phenylobacterium zucineum HLK1]
MKEPSHVRRPFELPARGDRAGRRRMRRPGAGPRRRRRGGRGPARPAARAHPARRPLPDRLCRSSRLAGAATLAPPGGRLVPGGLQCPLGDGKRPAGGPGVGPPHRAWNGAGGRPGPRRPGGGRPAVPQPAPRPRGGLRGAPEAGEGGPGGRPRFVLPDADGDPLGLPLGADLGLQVAVAGHLQPGDGAVVDLVGTVGQPQGPLVGVGARQAEVVGDPGPAVRLDGIVDHLQRHGRRLDLDHGDLQSGDLVAGLVHHVGRLQAQQAGHLDVDAGAGDPLLPDRMFRQVLAERLPGHQPLAHLLQRHLGRADGPHAVVDAPRPEPGLADLEPAPLAQDQALLDRHAHVLEHDLGVAVRGVVVAEHRQHPDHLDAGRVHRDQHLALLLVQGGVRVGLAHDDGHLAARVAHAARPPLAAVDDVVVAVTLDAGLDVGGVRRGDRRLGHQEGRADLALHQGLQPAVLLLARAEALQHLHVAGVGRRTVEHLGGEAHPAHDLGDQGVFQVRALQTLEPERLVHRRIAGRRRHEHVPEALGLGLGLQLLHHRDHLPAIALLVLGLVGRHGGIDVGLHERGDAPDELLLAGGVLEIHLRPPVQTLV